jgi:hypothetical protein
VSGGTLSAGTVSIGVKSNTKGFGKNLHNSLIGEIGGIGKSLGEAIVAGSALVLGVGLKEAMASESLNAQFTAGIKSTGNAANLSVKGMDDLAASIAGYSGQSYESIGSTEKLLQTFKNIKNVGPNKIFDQATAAAADMAAKMGGDASGTAIKLGRALADPVKGVMALTRVGVVFTQAQKDSIKAMVKHGDTMGAQKVILKELQTEFGGAAKAAGQTLPGQLKRSEVAFGELSKSVVETILPIVTPAIQGLAGKITAATPQIKAFAKSFSEDLKNAITTLTPYLKTFGSWIVDHKPLVIGFGVAAMGVAAAFKIYQGVMAVVKVVTATWAVIQGIATAATWLWTAGQWLLNAALTANPIGIVVMAVAALVGAIILIATKTTWFQTVWQYMTSSLAAAWRWMWNSVLAPIIRFVLNGFASITDGIANMLSILGHIPGFKWAKDAAAAMSGAADKAHALANGIKDIPNKVPVAVNFSSNFSAIAQQVASLANSRNALAAKAVGHNAAGTDNWRGGPTWVNERGGEIIDLPSGSRVIPADKSAAIMGGKDFDYDRLAEAVSRRQIKAVISVGSVDRALGGALR